MRILTNVHQEILNDEVAFNAYEKSWNTKFSNQIPPVDERPKVFTSSITKCGFEKDAIWTSQIASG
jgi:hypothetical protein